MKIALIQDKYNNNKIWIIKKYKDRSIYYNQKVGDKVLYSFNRTSKKFLKSLFENTEKALEIIEKIQNKKSARSCEQVCRPSLPRLVTKE